MFRMRGLHRSLALACVFSSRALADPNPIPSYELVERQTANTTNVSAATYIYSSSFDDDDDDGRRGPPAGVDQDGDGTGPPSWVTGPPSWVTDRGGSGGNFTFTVTVNPENNDLWFRMAAPSMYSWIGIAAGKSMSDAKAFMIAYEGSKQDSITLSPRATCDQCEPGYTNKLNANMTASSATDPGRFGIRDDMYYVSAFVKNGSRLAGIDPNKKDQSFIWAVGRGGQRPQTDDKDAPLRMHTIHGGFQLDMTQAHGTALPAFATVERAVTRQGGSDRDNDRRSTAHAVAMILGFVILLPLGIVLLRFVSVKAHMITQAVGLFIITIGWAMGFVISRNYQRSMNYTHHHQIIGIILYLLLLVQFTTGLLHHRIYKKTQQPTIFIKPHKYGLGAVVLSLGIINIAIGFRFAMVAYYNMIFAPIIIFIIILVAGGFFLKKFLAKRKAKAQMGAGVFGGPAPPYRQPSGSAVPGAEGYYGGDNGTGRRYSAGSASAPVMGATWDQRSDVELSKMGPPPSYDAQPQRPREML